MERCPSPEELQRAMVGSLDSERQNVLERHLDTCTVCQQQLEAAVKPAGLIPAGVTLSYQPDASDALHRAMKALSEQRLPTQPSMVEDPTKNWNELRPPFLQPPGRPDFLGRLGAYEIKRLIGRGGMGLVFEGLDSVLNRTVAIKVLSPLTALSAEDRARFLREAQAVAALDHEHIVAIHCVDQIQNLPFLVLQYVEGESLADRLLRRGPLPIVELVRLGVEVARGLAAAHAKGLIHRDIKPANILLEANTGRAKITDFGLAKRGSTWDAANEPTLTARGTIAGTPEFMSPEQAADAELDARTDLFSLGVVLYVAATDASPFHAKSPLQALDRVRSDEPRPLQELRPEFPHWFCQVVQRLMAKQPDQRIQTAQEVAALLERSQGVTPPPPRVADQTPQTLDGGAGRARVSRRWLKTGIWLVPTAILVAAIGIYIGLLRSDETNSKTTVAPAIGFTISGQSSVFQNLSDALSAAGDGDIIEVYGDGPYLVSPMTITGKKLTIRAATGGQPVFLSKTPDTPADQPFLQTDSSLLMEGLTIHWFLQAPAGTSEADMLTRCVILGTQGRVELKSCRIVVRQRGMCVGVSGHDLALTDCFCCCESGSAVFWRPPPRGQLLAENCVFEGRIGVTVMTAAAVARPAPASVRLTHNTFVADKSLHLALFQGPRQFLDFNSYGNLHDNSHYCAVLGFQPAVRDSKASDMINGVRSVAKWSEGGNVYRRGTQFIVILLPGGLLSADVGSVAQWLELWNQPPGCSVEGSIHFHKRDNSTLNQPMRFDRLDEPSAPAPARFGADIQRVGPGEPYHARLRAGKR